MKKILILLICIVPFSASAQTDDTNQSDPTEDEASRPIVKLDPITVEADRIEIKPRHTLDGRFIRSGTGSAGDPLRVLNHLPSMGVLNDFVGVLSVRGGGPEDNLYYFDRLPLGYPYHLLGIISTVNADVIENIDVYPGGFGAEFGADSQAVIDIHSRAKTDTWLGGTVNANFVYSQAFLEGNIGEQGYWYAFGRRSYIGPLFELLPRLFKIESDLVTEVPSFWSYQGKAVYQLNNTHRLVVNAIAADDSGELNFTSDEVSGDLPGPLSSNNPFDSQGIHLYSEKQDVFTSIVSLTRSFSRTELQFGDGYFYRSARSIYALRSDLAYWVRHPKTLLESGFVLSSLPTSLISVGSRPPEEGDPDYDFRLKQDGEKVLTNTSKSLHRLEGYLQATQDLPSPRYTDFYATVGIRANYFNLIDDFSLQPRGLLGVTLGPDSANTDQLSFFPIDLRLMYGNYVQNPQFYQVVLGKKNPEIASSLARHYVVALEKVLESKPKETEANAPTNKKRLPTRTTIEIAGYYKDLRDMITYNESERRYRNQRIGYVKGVEVSLDHEIGEAFRSWLSYAYIISKRQDSPRDDERFYMYNTPHVVTIGMNYQAESWECSANWQYKSGVLYSPLVDRERYTNPFTKNKTWLPIYGEIEREAAYHRLDLRLHKSFKSVFNFNKWKWGFTLELWNVYNRTNILQVRYDENYTKQRRIAQLPIIPFLAVTAEF
ncbi:MAG: TonB-dependent receptor plug domain-containing protein [Candidatus Poribacteria bacterium]|nr:TonB-dependent receptor plug domain-containing protein [Candidatus Poribacteria bacterium]